MIDHGDLSIPALVALMHTGLHGTAMASNELVMTEVMPTIAITRCPHTALGGAGADPSRPTRDRRPMKAVVGEGCPTGPRRSGV